MSKQRSQELIGLGDRLFSKKWQLDNLLQEIAWQFCPDLADFVSPIVLGDDWAADRMDSFPEQISRELSNQIGVMLRPQDRPWFRTTTLNDQLDADEANAIGLQYITGTIRQNLYNPTSKFVRATKELDRFYCNFGQGVMSIEESPRTRNHLFFRNHHLKNCAWLEDELGDIDHLHRKDKMTARAMIRRFPAASIHRNIREAAEKEPAKEFDLRVIVLPADEYDMVKKYAKEDDDGREKKRKLPFVIVYIDVENQTILKESGLPTFIYVVPRWLRFSDSQYAFSPAAMTGLADARMAQMLSQIILEAGEKAVDPPMIGKQEVVIGEPNIMAGGISWVDVEHDTSLKDALDIVNINADLRVGFEMRRDIREMLTKCFYIDKFALPEARKGMTAYEVAQRLDEHIRNLIPIFEPMQIEYNTRVLDLSFALLRNMGKFDWNQVPQDLLGSDITWAFQSPIQESQDRFMVEQFKASLEVLAMGAQSGATTKPVHIDKAMRDAIRGVGGPAIWRKTVEEMEAEQQQMAQQALVQKAMAELGQGAAIAGQVGDAANKLGFQPSADKMLMAQAKSGAGGGTGAVPTEAAPPAAEEGGAGDIRSLAAMPTAEGEAAPRGTPLQPAGATLDDVMNMQKRILAKLASLDDVNRKPKRITIKRNKEGKIESAEAEG